ncbi:MAG: hypothetical protein LBH92_03050 [Bacteroidales bacterium]|nr:hypothetical protein [Bacteroidales bacterium]
MKIKYLIPFLLMIAPAFLGAQEALIDLHGNPAIRQYLKSDKANVKTKSVASEAKTGMQLPFFDDFTYPGPYPDNTLWEDKDAFINTAFQIKPTNRGVATLDALDADGHIHQGAGSYPFIADHLTSRMIRTDSIINETAQRPLTLIDSLYLSFFYQPQGRGNAPDKQDSLVLEFFIEYADTIVYVDTTFYPADTLWIDPEDPSQGWISIDTAYWELDTTWMIYPEQWQRVWSTPGMTFETFEALYGQSMVQVMVPITDTAKFFKPDFRFRFRNYASLASNVLPGWQSNMDQWNIDYVYLNYGRSGSETSYQDISFVDPGNSLLQNYYSIPYKQFKANAFELMKSDFSRSYVNLDKVAQNASYKYRIYDENDVQIGTDDSYYDIEWTQPLSPGIVEDMVRLVVMFPSIPGKDSTFFTIEQTLVGDLLASERLCDTITYIQKFSNYIAYDDGVPESGYGLSDSDCMLAVQYSLFVADTLKAVDIYFNDTPQRQDSSYSEYFNLYIWRDNHGEPGDQLFVGEDMILKGAESGKFIRFDLNKTLIVNGGFFIGIMQTSSDNINIGFDYSNNTQSKNLYKLYNNSWKTTSYEGCLMMRPVFGTPEILPQESLNKDAKIVVHPNPVSCGKEISIEKPSFFDDRHNVVVDIFSGATTQNVYSAPYSSQITLQNIAPGLYIVRLTNHSTGEIATTKLIIIQ